MSEKDLVDAILEAADSLQSISNSIIPAGVAPGEDERGGVVGSLTESLMGVTGGLCDIAEAIRCLASAVEGLGDDAG